MPEDKDNMPANPDPLVEAPQSAVDDTNPVIETVPSVEDSPTPPPIDDVAKPAVVSQPEQEDVMSDTTSSDSQPMAADMPAKDPSPDLMTTTQKKPKKNTKLIVVALLVFAALSAVAVVLYLNDSSSNSKTSQQAALDQIQSLPIADQVPAEPATIADINTVSDEVDAALLSLDEAVDFSTDSLTDATLGL